MNKVQREYRHLFESEGMLIEEEWVAGSGHRVALCRYKDQTIHITYSMSPSDNRSIKNQRSMIRKFKKMVDQQCPMQS